MPQSSTPTWSEHLTASGAGRWVTMGAGNGKMHVYVRKNDNRIVAGPREVVGADAGHIGEHHASQEGASYQRHPDGTTPTGALKQASLHYNPTPHPLGRAAAREGYRQAMAISSGAQPAQGLQQQGLFPAPIEQQGSLFKPQFGEGSPGSALAEAPLPLARGQTGQAARRAARGAAASGAASGAQMSFPEMDAGSQEAPAPSALAEAPAPAPPTTAEAPAPAMPEAPAPAPPTVQGRSGAEPPQSAASPSGGVEDIAQQVAQAYDTAMSFLHGLVALRPRGDPDDMSPEEKAQWETHKAAYAQASGALRDADTSGVPRDKRGQLVVPEPSAQEDTSAPSGTPAEGQAPAASTGPTPGEQDAAVPTPGPATTEPPAPAPGSLGGPPPTADELAGSQGAVPPPTPAAPPRAFDNPNKPQELHGRSPVAPPLPGGQAASPPGAAQLPEPTAPLSPGMQAAPPPGGGEGPEPTAPEMPGVQGEAPAGDEEPGEPTGAVTFGHTTKHYIAAAYPGAHDQIMGGVTPRDQLRVVGGHARGDGEQRARTVERVGKMAADSIQQDGYHDAVSAHLLDQAAHIAGGLRQQGQSQPSAGAPAVAVPPAPTEGEGAGVTPGTDAGTATGDGGDVPGPSGYLLRPGGAVRRRPGAPLRARDAGGTGAPAPAPQGSGPGLRPTTKAQGPTAGGDEAGAPFAEAGEMAPKPRAVQDLPGRMKAATAAAGMAEGEAGTLDLGENEGVQRRQRQLAGRLEDRPAPHGEPWQQPTDEGVRLSRARYDRRRRQDWLAMQQQPADAEVQAHLAHLESPEGHAALAQAVQQELPREQERAQAEHAQELAGADRTKRAAISRVDERLGGYKSKRQIDLEQAGHLLTQYRAATEPRERELAMHALESRLRHGELRGVALGNAPPVQGQGLRQQELERARAALGASPEEAAARGTPPEGRAPTPQPAEVGSDEDIGALHATPEGRGKLRGLVEKTFARNDVENDLHRHGLAEMAGRLHKEAAGGTLDADDHAALSGLSQFHRAALERSRAGVEGKAEYVPDHSLTNHEHYKAMVGDRVGHAGIEKLDNLVLRARQEHERATNAGRDEGRLSDDQAAHLAGLSKVLYQAKNVKWPNSTYGRGVAEAIGARLPGAEHYLNRVDPEHVERRAGLQRLAEHIHASDPAAPSLDHIGEMMAQHGGALQLPQSSAPVASAPRGPQPHAQGREETKAPAPPPAVPDASGGATPESSGAATPEQEAAAQQFMQRNRQKASWELAYNHGVNASHGHLLETPQGRAALNAHMQALLAQGPQVRSSQERGAARDLRNSLGLLEHAVGSGRDEALRVAHNRALQHLGGAKDLLPPADDLPTGHPAFAPPGAGGGRVPPTAPVGGGASSPSGGQGAGVVQPPHGQTPVQTTPPAQISSSQEKEPRAQQEAPEAGPTSVAPQQPTGRPVPGRPSSGGGMQQEARLQNTLRQHRDAATRLRAQGDEAGAVEREGLAADAERALGAHRGQQRPAQTPPRGFVDPTEAAPVEHLPPPGAGGRQEEPRPERTAREPEGGERPAEARTPPGPTPERIAGMMERTRQARTVTGKTARSAPVPDGATKEEFASIPVGHQVVEKRYGDGTAASEHHFVVGEPDGQQYRVMGPENAEAADETWSVHKEGTDDGGRTRREHVAGGMTMHEAIAHAQSLVHQGRTGAAPAGAEAGAPPSEEADEGPVEPGPVQPPQRGTTQARERDEHIIRSLHDEAQKGTKHGLGKNVDPTRLRDRSLDEYEKDHGPEAAGALRRDLGLAGAPPEATGAAEEPTTTERAAAPRQTDQRPAAAQGEGTPAPAQQTEGRPQAATKATEGADTAATPAPQEPAQEPVGSASESSTQAEQRYRAMAAHPDQHQELTRLMRGLATNRNLPKKLRGPLSRAQYNLEQMHDAGNRPETRDGHSRDLARLLPHLVPEIQRQENFARQAAGEEGRQATAETVRQRLGGQAGGATTAEGPGTRPVAEDVVSNEPPQVTTEPSGQQRIEPPEAERREPQRPVLGETPPRPPRKGGPPTKLGGDAAPLRPTAGEGGIQPEQAKASGERDQARKDQDAFEKGMGQGPTEPRQTGLEEATQSAEKPEPAPKKTEPTEALVHEPQSGVVQPPQTRPAARPRGETTGGLTVPPSAAPTEQGTQDRDPEWDDEKYTKVRGVKQSDKEKGTQEEQQGAAVQHVRDVVARTLLRGGQETLEPMDETGARKARLHDWEYAPGDDRITPKARDEALREWYQAGTPSEQMAVLARHAHVVAPHLRRPPDPRDPDNPTPAERRAQEAWAPKAATAARHAVQTLMDTFKSTHRKPHEISPLVAARYRALANATVWHARNQGTLLDGPAMQRLYGATEAGRVSPTEPVHHEFVEQHLKDYSTRSHEAVAARAQELRALAKDRQSMIDGRTGYPRVGPATLHTAADRLGQLAEHKRTTESREEHVDHLLDEYSVLSPQEQRAKLVELQGLAKKRSWMEHPTLGAVNPQTVRDTAHSLKDLMAEQVKTATKAPPKAAPIVSEEDETADERAALKQRNKTQQDTARHVRFEAAQHAEEERGKALGANKYLLMAADATYPHARNTYYDLVHDAFEHAPHGNEKMRLGLAVRDLQHIANDPTLLDDERTRRWQDVGLNLHGLEEHLDAAHDRLKARGAESQGPPVDTAMQQAAHQRVLDKLGAHTQDAQDYLDQLGTGLIAPGADLVKKSTPPVQGTTPEAREARRQQERSFAQREAAADQRLADARKHTYHLERALEEARRVDPRHATVGQGQKVLADLSARMLESTLDLVRTPVHEKDGSLRPMGPDLAENRRALLESDMQRLGALQGQHPLLPQAREMLDDLDDIAGGTTAMEDARREREYARAGEVRAKDAALKQAEAMWHASREARGKPVRTDNDRPAWPGQPSVTQWRAGRAGATAPPQGRGEAQAAPVVPPASPQGSDEEEGRTLTGPDRPAASSGTGDTAPTTPVQDAAAADDQRAVQRKTQLEQTIRDRHATEQRLGRDVGLSKGQGPWRDAHEAKATALQTYRERYGAEAHDKLVTDLEATPAAEQAGEGTAQGANAAHVGQIVERARGDDLGALQSKIDDFERMARKEQVVGGIAPETAAEVARQLSALRDQREGESAAPQDRMTTAERPAVAPSSPSQRPAGARRSAAQSVGRLTMGDLLHTPHGEFYVVHHNPRTGKVEGAIGDKRMTLDLNQHAPGEISRIVRENVWYFNPLVA